MPLSERNFICMFDVIIVGAGPAGLSAALILGRCRRHVLVCDTGQYRNTASSTMHGFLTRDGIDPHEFLQSGREQLRPYENVELRSIEVTGAVHSGKYFEVTFAGGAKTICRKLLIATGVVDDLPPVEGIEALYGQSVFHCPYCDGWEVRDQPLAIYGRGENGEKLALELTVWSRDLVLCTDGPSDLEDRTIARLKDNGIVVREERIARVEGTDGKLERIIFTNGEALPRKAIFFSTDEHQRSDLAEKLGSRLTHKGVVNTDDYERTNVPGLYVAGDASRRVQLVIVAAAEGAQAAFAINTTLLKEDLV